MLGSRVTVVSVLLGLGGALLTGGTTASAAPPTSAGHDVAKPAACHHLAPAHGLTSTTITLGNASDLSGTVPGLEESAQQAAQAYVAYFNHVSTVCGRTVELTEYDTRTDAGADQVAYTAACRQTFATVGSASAFDSGGAAVAQSCGLPDLRVRSSTSERRSCRTCLAVHPENPTQFPNAVADLVKKTYGADHAALLYLDAGENADRAAGVVRNETHRGLKLDYLQAVATTEFNYLPFAQRLKEDHITSVQFLTGGQVAPLEQLAQAMQQVGYHPLVYLLDPTAYTPHFEAHGVNTVVYLDTQPFEAPQPSKELTRYRHWLHVVSPGARPTVDGVYAWSATRLVLAEAQILGTHLTRARLVAKLRTVTAWRDNHLHAPQHVGSGDVGACERFVRRSGDTWVPLAGRTLHCSGVGEATPRPAGRG